jgi:ATP-binding cassette subfamily B protein
LAGYVRSHTWALAGVTGFATVSTALGVAQPYLSKLIIDEGLIARRMAILIGACAGMVVLAALNFLLGAFNRWLYVRTSGEILFSLREDVYAHLLKLSPEFYRTRSVGDLVTRLDGDVAEVQRFSTDTLLSFVNGALLLVASAAVMLTLSATLTAVAAAALPLQLGVRHRSRRYITDATRSVREQTGKVASFFVETLGAAKAVQGAGAESWEHTRLETLNRDLLSRIVHQQLIGYTVGGISGLLSHATTAAVFIAGGLQVIHGNLTVGTLIAFIAYLTRGSGSAGSLLNLYTAYQRAAVSLTRVRELMDVQPQDRAVGTLRPEPVRELAHSQDRGSEAGLIRLESHSPGHVIFDQVSLQRPGMSAPLFNRFSLEIAPGSKIVLCGESGAGKSTLVDLLRGFAQPDGGRILVDQVELTAYELSSVRRHITVLEAEPVLFRGTLEYNLRYGHFDASAESVREAARRAGVDALVRGLPHGYDTEIGAGGTGLSTGQRQRIAIARALLGDPVILVLDEATSNLDPAAARTLHDLFDEHFNTRTRLIITHAPRKVPRPGRIIALRDSQLIELPPQPQPELRHA